MAEVLEAVKKDRSAVGAAAAALPQIVLVSLAPRALSPACVTPCQTVQSAGVLVDGPTGELLLDADVQVRAR